jgi:hypothetical protein
LAGRSWLDSWSLEKKKARFACLFITLGMYTVDKELIVYFFGKH